MIPMANVTLETVSDKCSDNTCPDNFFVEQYSDDLKAAVLLMPNVATEGTRY
jgi:hypothetical protein